MGNLRAMAGAAAWVLAVAGFSVALLAHGGRFSLALDAFSHLAPASLAGGLAALALAVLARPRSWTWIGALAAAVVLNAAIVMGPELAARPASNAAPPEPQLKIVQFNVWADNQRAEDAARWILAQDPDVIVLEEGWLVRSRLMAAGYEPACYGCAPVIFARSKPLRRFPPKGLYGDGSGFSWGIYRDDRFGEFAVVAVHGPWPHLLGRLRAQSRALQADLAKLPRDRVILAGDLNGAPWSHFQRRRAGDWGLTRRTAGVFTWPAQRVSHYPLPAPFAFLPIDHVYAGPGWRTVRVERGPRLGSDHYPLVVTLAPVRPPT